MGDKWSRANKGGERRELNEGIRIISRRPERCAMRAVPSAPVPRHNNVSSVKSTGNHDDRSLRQRGSVSVRVRKTAGNMTSRHIAGRET